MQSRKIILGTVGYILVTFPLAILWHVVLFEPQYLAFGYLDEDPSFTMGFLTIVLQGAILTFLYPLVRFNDTGLVKALKYTASMGAFFWTSHVLAFVAKQNVPDAGLFIFLETLYLCFQFGVYAIILAKLFPQVKREKGVYI